MARTEEYEGKPKPDVFLVLILITFFALLIATTIMFLEGQAIKG